MKFNMKLLKKKYWFLILILFVLSLAFLVYYYNSPNEYCEGAQAKSTLTAGQLLVGNTLVKNSSVCGVNGNSISCMQKLSSDLIGNNNKDYKKSLLIQNDSSSGSLNSNIMKYGNYGNYEKSTATNKKGSCMDVGKVVSYATTGNSELINKYQKDFTAGC